MTAPTHGTGRIVAPPIAAILVFLAAHQSAAADADRGTQLAATCASCHRLDGRDKVTPPIVGRDEESVVRMMHAFRSGERPSQLMHAVALSLSDEEIAAVARYLATRGKKAGQP
jgi:cytochrome c553